MYEENLGKTAKDLISGFKGVVTGVTEYLHGTDRVSLQPPAKGNSLPKVEVFDCVGLELAKTKRKISKPKFKKGIKVGQKVEDPISKYVGTVLAIGYHINGCRRIGVLAEVHKDFDYRKPDELFWFDERQLEVL